MACTQVELQSLHLYLSPVLVLYQNLSLICHRLVILVGLERKRIELLGYLNSSLPFFVLGLKTNKVEQCDYLYSFCVWVSGYLYSVATAWLPFTKTDILPEKTQAASWNLTFPFLMKTKSSQYIIQETPLCRIVRHLEVHFKYLASFSRLSSKIYSLIHHNHPIRKVPTFQKDW
jgi:hypothetical protein